MDQEVRLNKRYWIINRMDLLLRESDFHKTHKENFTNPKLRLWKWDDEEGRVSVDG